MASTWDGKFSDVTYRTKDGFVQKRMWAADISPDKAITEVKRVVHAIFGQETTLQLAKQLRGKVKQILDSIVAKTHLLLSTSSCP